MQARIRLRPGEDQLARVMTLSIAFLFIVLAVMVWAFMTEVLPIELTAFLGLLVLIVTGYVPVGEAFDGFASPAVITMFSIFFISAALLETGVADRLGEKIHGLVGGREVPVIVLVMAVAGVLSAFMNNIAAAAVLLPAVSSLGRRAGIPPGRLFMPLSFGAILGGTTTLVGTPPNILASEVLIERGLEPFSLFDFTPIGLALLGVGILFMTTLGRRLLPRETPSKGAQETGRLTRAYRVEERLTTIRVPKGSSLVGLTLAEAKLGATLDVRVLSVERGGDKQLAPPPNFRLAAGDLMLVDGAYADLRAMLDVQGIAIEESDPGHLEDVSTRVRGLTLRVRRGAGVAGRSLAEIRFRDRFGVLVVGIRRDGELLRQQLPRTPLSAGDEVLVLGKHERLTALTAQTEFAVVGGEVSASELLRERLFRVRVGAESPLAGEPIGKSRIGELVGLTVVGVLRDGETLVAVSAEEVLLAGDELLIAGEPTRVVDLLRLGQLEMEPVHARSELESDEVSVTEAVIAPRSSLAGRSLQDLRFRERYGVQVLAVWRESEPIHQDLPVLALRVGDALLLHGPREKIQLLTADPDFIVLNVPQAEPRRTHKAPAALGALALMIVLVVSGLYPVHVVAFAGAVTAVLFGALRMEDAYRSIEWRALFLVAAILPVGGAMEGSGAAQLLAGGIVTVAQNYGPYAFLAALVLLSSMLSQALDGAPTVVILAPVVILTAEQLGVSPYPLMMAVGLAASAAFMTPFSHKANLLVMSAGGYRAMDYVRVGTPLTVVVLALIVLLVPVFFPW